MSTYNDKGQLIEVLAYDGQSKSGAKETVYYAYLGDLDADKIQQKIDTLTSQGHVNVRAISWEDYEEICAAEAVEKYNVNKPFSITKARFWELLEVLPPCRWASDYDFESFYVSECITLNLYTFCVRIGNGNNAQYFEIVADRNITNASLKQLCLEQMNSNPIAA